MVIENRLIIIEKATKQFMLAFCLIETPSIIRLHWSIKMSVLEIHSN